MSDVGRVADAIIDARTPLVKLGQGDYTREIPAKVRSGPYRPTIEVPKESPTDHAARMARESFEDAVASMSSDTLRAIIEKYDAADRDKCRAIVAESIEHGRSRDLVCAVIVAMHAELQRRAGK